MEVTEQKRISDDRRGLTPCRCGSAGAGEETEVCGLPNSGVKPLDLSVGSVKGGITYEMPVLRSPGYESDRFASYR